ncbi:NAD(P)-binding protein [Ningiella sp. W23]|uniref:NAD(P)-binding protein n=1 Tax=Ningiella sp. W23 TaxID=3023715 RepID=UPI003756D19D
MMNNIAIVGGGIAGIYAAMLTKTLKPKANVVLIEQGDVLGGLLASKTFTKSNADGGESVSLEFDYGTHVPRMIGHSDIDNLLFGALDKTQWRLFNDINAANVSLNNALYTRSAAPYIGPENNPQHESHFAQMLQASKLTDMSYHNLKQQLIHQYGSGYVNSFFAPCLQQKLGVGIEQLAPDTHKLIGLGRIIVDNANRMRELKTQDKFDDILSFADQTDGMSNLSNMYPENGRGIGLWVESLTKQLKQLGVIIKTGCHVTEILRNGKEAKHIWLSDNSEYAIDYLCWCGPAFSLIHAARLNFTSQYRPQIRQTRLYHFAFDKPFTIDSNYVDVNDPQYKSFRVTLYPNLSGHNMHTQGNEGTSKSHYKCTVEVIEAQNATNSPSPSDIEQEIREMGLIHANSTCIFQAQDIVKAGFPIMTPEFHKEVARQQTAISSQLSNVSALGKASGKSFFMAQVLVDAHEQLSHLLAQQNESQENLRTRTA